MRVSIFILFFLLVSFAFSSYANTEVVDVTGDFLPAAVLSLFFIGFYYSFKTNRRLKLELQEYEQTSSGAKQNHDYFLATNNITKIEFIEKLEVFKQFFDNAPVAIWLLDKNGKLLFVNKAFCLSSGMSEERLLNADHYFELFPEDIAENYMISDAACILQKEPHQSYEKIKFADNRIHEFEITKVRVCDENNRVKGLIGLRVEITTSKTAS